MSAHPTVNGRVEEDRQHPLVHCAVCVPNSDPAFAEAVVGFNRQPVSHAFADDGVERRLTCDLGNDSCVHNVEVYEHGVSLPATLPQLAE